jgi:hypothetical protein
MTLRAKLREAVTRRLLPELKRRGFTGPEKISGNALAYEFSRARAERDERLSVQFEKKQRPRFILNIWIEPPGGAEALIRSGGVWIQGRVSQKKGAFTGSWFRAERPLWQRLVGMNSSLEEDAVDQALMRLDAIDDWFQNPRETDLVRIISCRYRSAEKKEPNQPPEPTRPSGPSGSS